MSEWRPRDLGDIELVNSRVVVNSSPYALVLQAERRMRRRDAALLLASALTTLIMLVIH